MGKLSKADVLAADPTTLNETDKGRLDVWLSKGEVSTFVPQSGTEKVDYALSKAFEEPEKDLEVDFGEIETTLIPPAPPEPPIEEVQEPQMDEDPGPPELKSIEEVQENGEPNQPPLELTPEIEQEAIAKTKAQQEELLDIAKHNVKKVDNKVNNWVVLAKEQNDVMAFDFTTKAMKVGKRGVLVCVKETINSNVTLGIEYIPNAVLAEVDGKWQLT